MKNILFLVGFMLFFLLTSNQSFSQSPVNDECSGAISLAVNADNSCTKSYSGKIGFATQGLAPSF